MADTRSSSVNTRGAGVVMNRPVGITIFSAVLVLLGLAELTLTLVHHVGGFSGVARLLVVLGLLLLGFSLWRLQNAARTFLFFLLTADIIACLLALFLYALRQGQYRVAITLVIQIGISAALLWYLQSAGVKRAFAGQNPW